MSCPNPLNGFFVKDPLGNLDYTINWAEWLATGDTIVSVLWTVPTGITETSTSNTTTTATIWLSGGTPVLSYVIDCKITTAQGRTDARQITVEVQTK